MDINYIKCIILWYIMHVCLSVAWNGLNNVIMIYCLNTVYHAGFFFALRYLDKEVHGKEDKIWGWWHKPMHNHTSVDYICDDDDDGVSISGPWQCYLGDTQCYLEKSKSIFHPPHTKKNKSFSFSTNFQGAADDANMMWNNAVSQLYFSHQTCMDCTTICFKASFWPWNLSLWPWDFMILRSVLCWHMLIRWMFCNYMLQI